MTADFSNLTALAVTKDDTADLTLYTVVGEPILTVRPAGEANKPYFNHLLKHTGKYARRLKASKISATMLAENRDEDRALFPKFVIVNWNKRPPIDAAGKSAPFNEENCVAFIKALPDDVFDEVRDFATNMENFRDDDFDTEAVAKNSQSGSSGTSE